MANRIFSGILLALLLTSMTTLAFSVQPVKASGTIYIRGDGSVDPPTTPIYTADNIAYTLTGNITADADGIVIERNNIVINGAGHTVTGSGSGNGTTLMNRSNVTVNSIIIENFTNGIFLYFSSDNTFSGNTITSNNEYGIWLQFSSNNALSGNNVANNYNGIRLGISRDNTLSGNDVKANHAAGIVLYSPSLLAPSSNNTFSGNTITNNGYGIIFSSFSSHSSNNFIFHNNFVNNTIQVYTTGSTNVWDDGYPSGGNYWGGLNPADENKDKIGDVPYKIDENNTDRYPLIYPFECYESGYKPTPDLNKDGIVNILDVTVVARAYSCQPGDINWNPAADMDMNEIINIIDISLVAKDYGKTV